MIKIKDKFRKGDAVKVTVAGHTVVGTVVRDMGHEFQVRTDLGVFTLSNQDTRITPVDAVAAFNAARG